MAHLQSEALTSHLERAREQRDRFLSLCSGEYIKKSGLCSCFLLEIAQTNISLIKNLLKHDYKLFSEDQLNLKII
jgi:hypothetical protein